MRDLIIERLNDSIKVKQELANNDAYVNNVCALADAMIFAINNGGKLVICGNGGSASDALHFAGEIVGRFQKERKPWPAIVLNADVATMTAIANDYGYDDIFARQAEAHLTPKDIFIGISTSGNSENVVRAINVAKQIGAKTACLVGKDGGKLGQLADFPIIIPCNVTARVQESHITTIHILCEYVEAVLAKKQIKIQ